MSMLLELAARAARWDPEYGTGGGCHAFAWAENLANEDTPRCFATTHDDADLPIWGEDIVITWAPCHNPEPHEVKSFTAKFSLDCDGCGIAGYCVEARGRRVFDPMTTGAGWSQTDPEAYWGIPMPVARLVSEIYKVARDGKVSERVHSLMKACTAALLLLQDPDADEFAANRVQAQLCEALRYAQGGVS